MFKKVYESVPPPYRLPGQDGLAPAILGQFLYNDYLTTAPRIYGEEISRATGIFTRKWDTPTCQYVVCVLVWTTQIHWPSWDIFTYVFDGVTGEFIERNPAFPAGYYTDEVFEARGGTLWMSVLASSLHELDPYSLQLVGDSIPATKYGMVGFYAPLVDKQTDTLVARLPSSNNQLGVYRFSTGELLRTIVIPGLAIKCSPEDGTRCYVLSNPSINSNDATISLVDFAAGEVLAVYKSPVDAYYNDVWGTRFAWDPHYRRLLFFPHRVHDETGACLSTVTGYYPVTLPVAITTPIPLVPPRKGRVVPVLSRTIGDVGEGLPGLAVTPTVDSPHTLVGPSPATDGDGYAVSLVMCGDSESLTVTHSVEAP